MMRRGSVAVVASLSMLSACSLLFAESEGASDGGGAVDAGSRDAGSEDAGTVDAGEPDAVVISSQCGPELSGTIGQFSVDGDDDEETTVRNSVVGQADGLYRTVAGPKNPTIVLGDSICRNSVKLGPPFATYAEFPDDAFPNARSVDFWFRPREGETSKMEGLLTKDESSYRDGNFGIYMVRNMLGFYQILAQSDAGGGSRSCSSSMASQAVGLGEWHHLAVSFSVSGKEMNVYLDGQALAGKELLIESESQVTPVGCTPGPAPATSTNIAANAQEWLWGAGRANLPILAKVGSPASDFLGQLDELRFRSMPMTEGQALDIYNERVNP